MVNKILWISGIVLMVLTGCSSQNHSQMKEKDMQKNAVPDVSEISVLDLDSHSVALNSLWEDRRIVLVFLRHYG
ncbi:hypothetical protein LZ24_01481 [Desulfobotulus alkaliphilus]|nr:hypothetical protein LZ24_01481 [Desulfobotulus alkaliphilus]